MSSEIKPSLHIVFLIQALRGGGAERILQTLAEFICSQGHQLTIFTLEYAPQAYQMDPRIRVQPFFTSRICRGPTKLLLLPFQVGELVFRLSRMRYDGFSSFMFRANFVAVLAGKLTSGATPLVITEHIPPTRYYNPNSMKGFVMLGLTRLLYPLAARIQAVSECVKQSLCELGVPPPLITVIPNAIDVSEIRRQAQRPHELHGWIKIRPTIVNVGRLFPEKDQRTLVEALFLVRKELDAQLLLVGVGPDRYELGQVVESLGLEPYVKFAGWQTNPFTLCDRCQLFAFSSLYEGFGLALVEAMCISLPVVSTASADGREEILLDGHCGLIIPPAQPRELAKAILLVLNDHEMAQKLSERAAARAEDYDISRIGPKFLQFISRST